MGTLITKLVEQRAAWVVPEPFHQHFVDLALERFVSVLGEIGDNVARALLLQMIDQPKIGETARASIRRIDDRSHRKECP